MLEIFYNEHYFLGETGNADLIWGKDRNGYKNSCLNVFPMKIVGIDE